MKQYPCHDKDSRETFELIWVYHCTFVKTLQITITEMLYFSNVIASDWQSDNY